MFSMRDLPSAGQAFKTIRDRRLQYVDKTAYIGKMIGNDGCHFLSRPSRFGKPLLLDAIQALFEGHWDLFQGLWIGSSGYDFKPFPVVRLSLDAARQDADGMSNYLGERLMGPPEKTACICETRSKSWDLRLKRMPLGTA
jgi:hypothetical protein